MTSNNFIILAVVIMNCFNQFSCGKFFACLCEIFKISKHYSYIIKLPCLNNALFLKFFRSFNRKNIIEKLIAAFPGLIDFISLTHNYPGKKQYDGKSTDKTIAYDFLFFTIQIKKADLAVL